MQVVPNMPHPESTGSERKVLKLLRSVDWGGASGRALSSLNLPERVEWQRWREIDFLVVGAPGLIAIEVKGGAVSYSSGRWKYEDGYGRVVSKRTSPIVQVKDAYFALERDYISPRFGSSYARSVPMGFCAILAGSRRSELGSLLGSPELPVELTGTLEDVANPAALGSFLKRVAAYWRDRSQASARIPERDVRTLVSLFRPEFEQVKPLALTRDLVTAELVKLTEEQYDVLDQWEGAQRVLCNAPAGCGKTLLAVELLRRGADEGRNCLFVSGTRQLAMAVKRDITPSLAGRVMAIEEIEALPVSRRPKADVVIIDEGQQMLSRERMGILDGLIVSGINNGRWIWFGDSNYQLPYSQNVAEDALQALENAATVQPRLRRNCRNTPEIISMAEYASGIPIGHAKVKGRGSHPRFMIGRDVAMLHESVAQQVAEWLSEDIPCEDICIVSEEANVGSLAEAAGVSGGFSVQPWAPRSEDPNAIRYASVEEFRGLESPFLVLCIGASDAGDETFTRMLYLAMTRANFALTIVASGPEVGRIEKLVEESALKGQGELD